jgi:hypothetical protein
MPVETIKCRECGSGEVSEFKPGRYVCAHCEAVFKEFVGETPGAAGCAVGACGVAAIGRCAWCGQAFCGTHQARDFDQRGYVDWCAECQAKQVATRQRTADAVGRALTDEASELVRKILAGAKGLATTRNSGGLPTLPLVAAEHHQTPRVTKTWLESTEEFGRGWKLPRSVPIHHLEGHEAWLALRDDGALFAIDTSGKGSDKYWSRTDRGLAEVGRGMLHGDPKRWVIRVLGPWEAKAFAGSLLRRPGLIRDDDRLVRLRAVLHALDDAAGDRALRSAGGTQADPGQ